MQSAFTIRNSADGAGRGDLGQLSDHGLTFQKSHLNILDLERDPAPTHHNSKNTAICGNRTELSMTTLIRCASTTLHSIPVIVCLMTDHNLSAQTDIYFTRRVHNRNGKKGVDC